MGKPNILTILVDDMGYSDLGCYGGEVETPNLDRMAGAGVRFGDFYCTPRCCPSRASLLTGLTPHRAGVGWMTFDWKRHCDADADGYAGTLNRTGATIAEALKPAGYRTFLSGKWHLTAEPENKKTWPPARGFDRSFSLITGGTSYFHPQELTLDDRFYLPPEGRYFTDLIGDFAVEFLEEHCSGHPDEPFFGYVAFTAPHFPLEAPETLVEKYRATYDRGWDILREQRDRKLKQLGLIPEKWALPTRPEAIPAWDSLPQSERERQSRNMATYAAMIEVLDANVGKILECIRRLERLDDTLVMFLSDNGACAEGPLMGSATHYGECWAHLSNTPFQLYKHFTLQGGVQTPFIAHWPAATGAGKNRIENDWTGCLYDIMPTCLHIAEAAYPPGFAVRSAEELDGVSLIPAIKHGRPAAPRAPRPDIFVEHEGNQMLRSGRFKLARQHRDEFRKLFDMHEDGTELHDLSGEQVERYAELCRRYDAWERDAGVLPWERAGRYMDIHGFRTYVRTFKERFAQALREADRDQIVDARRNGAPS